MFKIILGIISFVIANFIYKFLVLGLALSKLFPNEESEIVSAITKCIETAPLFCELFVSAFISIFVYKIIDEILSIFKG
jgi:hypothetical protein